MEKETGIISCRILKILDDLSIAVNDYGEIFSLHHNGIRKNGRIDNRQGRRIKPAIDRDGYYRCTFSHKGKRKTFQVQQLVALAFIPNPQNKPTVNHIDGIKTNNQVSNLEWATYSEQKIHSTKNHLCDKNVRVLADKNKKRSIPIIFNGAEYPSINDAHKKTQRSWQYIKNNSIKKRCVNE